LLDASRLEPTTSAATPPRYEAHHNEHRPHRSLKQAASLKAISAPVSDLNALRVRRHDRIGGIIHEYTLAA
jgi:putative transposase